MPSAIGSKPNMLRRSAISALLLALVCVCAPACAAAEAPRQELTPEEKHYALKKIRDTQKDIRAIAASVTQEKRLATLKKLIVTEGTIVVARPSMLRWDIQKPERTITVLDGKTMTVYRPGAREAQMYHLSEHAIARNSAAFFATAMSGDFDELERKFNVRLFRSGGDIVFSLEPVGIAVRYIASITIAYSESTGLPRVIELITPKGDRIKTTLSRVRINPTLKDDAFSLPLPQDVRVTNRSDDAPTRN